MSSNIFSSQASQWWDPSGPAQVLHDINPCRLSFIQTHCTLNNRHCLDIGCGGGILSEALAKEGAQVTGIDLEAALIAVAKMHATHHKLGIEYFQQTLETHLESNPQYDAVFCLEMLEHTKNPQEIIKNAIHCLKPRGKLFISTLNRSYASYFISMLCAEKLLNIVPNGTHEYNYFIKPSQIRRWAEPCRLIALKGLYYSPSGRRAYLKDQTGINYIACFQKP